MGAPKQPTASGSFQSSDQGYQRSLELHVAIESMYPRIGQHAAHFRGMMPVDPVFPTPPGVTGGTRVDPLICALAIKAATTKRTLVAVSELGDGDNALVLARVLLENACLIEWLIRGEGRRRLEAYAMFTSVVRERIVSTVNRHQARFMAAGAQPGISSDPYHAGIWKHVFHEKSGRPTKSDRPTWEFDCATKTGRAFLVKEIFREIAATEESFEYDVLYGALGSDVVHSGPFSLTRTLQALEQRGVFTLEPAPVTELRTIAIATSNTAMFLVLDSLTEYIGLDLSAELDALKTRAKIDPYAGATPSP